MCIGLFMATDSSCSIKRIKEVNYISKYLKTHSTHQVSDLSIIKHLFLQNMFFSHSGKVQNHFVNRLIQVVSGHFYTVYTKKEKTNNAALCAAGFIEPVK